MGWVKIKLAKILIIIASAIYALLAILIFALLMALGNNEFVKSIPGLVSAWIGFGVFLFIFMLCAAALGIAVGVLKVE